MKAVGGRADAERNRERILHSARRIYREQGPDAPLDRIATEAGVGNATLYRHFPSREALRTAVLTDRMLAVEAFLTELEGEPDPWSAVDRYIRFLAATPDNTLTDVLLTDPASTPELQAMRERIRTRVDALLSKAHRAGVLRPGYTVKDMNVFLFAHAKAATATLIHPADADPLLDDYIAGIRREP